ncbi:hypothetical protein COOONC_26455, partial [Cooperia oncophora]
LGFDVVYLEFSIDCRCSLFLLDNEHKELVANVFDNAGDLSEIRLPMTKGVVGRVATTRSMMNVRDVKRCPFFYARVDQLTGFHTRNILCFPIIDNSEVLVISEFTRDL